MLEFYQPENSVDLPPTQELSTLPPAPDQHNDEMSVKSNAKSPAVEQTSSLSSNALHQPQASPQRPNSSLPHPQESTESDPLVSSTQFGSCDGSPSSIVLENSEEKLDDIESVGEFMTHQIIVVKHYAIIIIIYTQFFKFLKL